MPQGVSTQSVGTIEVEMTAVLSSRCALSSRRALSSRTLRLRSGQAPQDPSLHSGRKRISPCERVAAQQRGTHRRPPCGDCGRNDRDVVIPNPATSLRAGSVHCHPEPYDFAQGRLCEGSCFGDVRVITTNGLNSLLKFTSIFRGGSETR